MGDFTNHAKNQLADFARGGALSFASSWWLAFVEDSSDIEENPVEVSGLARVEYASGLTKWAGTQGPGTSLASFGTSHTTSNNEEIGMGLAAADAEAVGVALFDAASGGNAWAVYRLPLTLIIAIGDNPKILPGNVGFSLGLGGGMSDYLANVLIDLLFRQQAYTWPASLWSAGYTAAPSNAGGGIEISGGVGYARAEIASTADAWSSTLAPGDTGPSDGGTSGRMSNNAPLAHPLPTAIQGVWTHAGLHDAATAGNLMFWNELDNPRTVSLGSPAPNYPADSVAIIWD